MAKKKFRPPPPYGPKPYNPNAGTQVGEREYNPNSVTRYNADQFLKNQPTAGSMITPGFKEMGNFMNWLQQFVNVNRDEYNTNPFSELKPNPLMAQLRAGINPYPGTRGYIPPTAPGIGGSSGGSSGGIAGGNDGRKGGPTPPTVPLPQFPIRPPGEGAGRGSNPGAGSKGAPPPPFGPMPKPIPGPMPPGNKIPPSMPSPKFPSPRPQLPRPEQPMQPPKKITPKPKQVKPTLNSFIPRYERK